MDKEATQHDEASPVEEDMDKLFDEAAGINPDAADEQEEGVTADEQEEGEEPGQQEDEAGGEEQDGGGTNDEKVLDLSDNTVKPDATDKAAPAKTEVKKPEEKPAAPSWRDALTPEAKAEVERLEKEAQAFKHRARSDAGRVAALTRRVEELSRAAKNETSAEREKREALLRETMDQYPSLGASITAVREEAQQRADKLEQELAEERRQKFMREAVSKVETVHPGWLQTIKTPAFKSWLEAQSAEVKELARSDEPEHAVLMLDAFREKHPATSIETQEAEKPQQDATPEKKPASKTAAEIKAEREKKLEASQGVATTRAAVRDSTTSGSLDSDFDQAVKAAERRAKR